MILPDRKILVRAPLRLSLAGGGTDVEPFATEFGSKILNFAVNLLVEVLLETTSSYEKSLEVELQNGIGLEPRNSFIENIEKTFLHRIPTNLSAKMRVKNPVGPGSGLGTSSAMLLAMRIAIETLASSTFSEDYIINDTFLIERKEMEINGGFQDYYPAMYGGMNWIVQQPGSSVRIREKMMPKEKIKSLLENNLVCLELGISRKGEAIINDQVARMKDKVGETLAALGEQLKLAEQIRNSVLDDDVDLLLESLKESYTLKKKYTPLISNDYIEQVERELIHIGARGLKISGAGGGGHMFCFFPDGVPGNLMNYLPPQAKRIFLSCSQLGFHYG